MKWLTRRCGRAPAAPPAAWAARHAARARPAAARSPCARARATSRARTTGGCGRAPWTRAALSRSALSSVWPGSRPEDNEMIKITTPQVHTRHSSEPELRTPFMEAPICEIAITRFGNASELSYFSINVSFNGSPKLPPHGYLESIWQYGGLSKWMRDLDDFALPCSEYFTLEKKTLRLLDNPSVMKRQFSLISLEANVEPKGFLHPRTMAVESKFITVQILGNCHDLC